MSNVAKAAEFTCSNAAPQYEAIFHEQKKCKHVMSASQQAKLMSSVKFHSVSRIEMRELWPRQQKRTVLRRSMRVPLHCLRLVLSAALW
eukprot:s689_g19.t1